MGKLFEIVKDLLKSFRFLLPLIFISVTIYMFYARFTKSGVEKTVEDIVYITSHMYNNLQDTVYRDLNNDTLVYSNSLPIDIKTKMTSKGYKIENRLGSQMSVMGAYKTKAEKDYYVVKDSRISKPYKGVGAYIITFPHIRRSACILLAQVDWKKNVPNFLGISVGRIDEENPKGGVERLNLGLLQGYMKIDYDGPDKAFVANRPLSYREAFEECKCFLHRKCAVSLKFF